MLNNKDVSVFAELLTEMCERIIEYVDDNYDKLL